jgi:RNA polymerase sigma-70 factor (ECF subfamily)
MAEQRWEVYERHAPALQRFAARRVEPDAVDDVVAEVFAIAWRKLPREGDPLPWLYAVAGKVIHTHRRSYARRTSLLARVAGRLGSIPAPADPADLIDSDPQLARAFATLTAREQEAICLIAWEGLSQQDAARAAGCSPATLAVRYSRARVRLTAALEQPPTPPRTISFETDVIREPLPGQGR